MAKNHYIPSLIIRRFSEKINIFNINTGEFLLDKKPEKYFLEHDIYPDIIESNLKRNVESNLANILDLNILNKDKIILKRKYLYKT